MVAATLSHRLCPSQAQGHGLLPGELAPDAAEWNISGGMSCPWDESKRL